MNPSTLPKSGSIGFPPWLQGRRNLSKVGASVFPPAPPAAHVSNAVVQLIAALRDSGLGAIANHALVAVGERDWTRHPPLGPIDGQRIAVVHRALRLALPMGLAPSVLARAGKLTADDLLGRRIPARVQWLLSRLPGPLAIRLAAPVVAAQAAVFAGSGALHIRPGSPTILEITDNAFCAGEHARSPVCAWQAATFQRLFEGLLGRPAHVVETDCRAAGDECCRFVVVWGETERRQRLTRRLSETWTVCGSDPIAAPRRSSIWACVDSRMSQLPDGATLCHRPSG